ncbi:hypothetical protein [Streptomyces fructofermentans]|uniref:Uncharacterized protein n=1 Tax=Streptomyces fructofermentans TaxID=152141 RepID=A0A918U5X5_9ACTN|nr:hypothetical protein [Streptomyces fructofermentans]GGX96815.1 hypothetical protein GCM10010515_74160 [Streptomyces fructofermentans]
MGTPVRTPSDGPPLVTERGLVGPVLEMEFTARFSRGDGESSAEAAAVAVTRAIDAPPSFVVPVLDAGRSASRCLLERSAADMCRVVLTADRAGITVAATDDVAVSLASGDRVGARHLPVLAVVDGLRVHHGPDGHVWVVWKGDWRQSRDGL